MDSMAISVPFKWEEAPGKPKPIPISSRSMESPALQLPPRLQCSLFLQEWPQASLQFSSQSPLRSPTLETKQILPQSHSSHTDARHENLDILYEDDKDNASIVFSLCCNHHRGINMTPLKRVNACHLSPFKLLKLIVREWKSIGRSEAKQHIFTAPANMWSPSFATYLALVLEEERQSSF